MNSFFRLLRYAKPYKGRLAWAVLAMVIVIALSDVMRLELEVWWLKIQQWWFDLKRAIF